MSILKSELGGEYSGAALSAFIRGLGQSKAVIQRILSPYGLETIHSDQWYDLNLARSIYYDLGNEIGNQTLFKVGTQMILSADFPPDIKSIEDMLQNLSTAYQMNCRGVSIGGIAAEILENGEARIISSTPFPCRLEQGIILGCCAKFGVTPLIDHENTVCRDNGNGTCEYHLTW